MGRKMSGDLVYERKSSFSLPLFFFIESVIFLLVMVLFPLSINSIDSPVFMVIMFLLFFMFSLLILFAFQTMAGMAFKIYTEHIWIKTGFMFKNFKQTDPIDIYAKDIVKIIYLNRTIHIYHIDRKTGKSIRNFIHGGRGLKEFDNVAYKVFSGKNDGKKWRGPPVFNIGNRIKEDIDLFKIISVLTAMMVLPPILLISPFLVNGLLNGYDGFYLHITLPIVFLFFFIAIALLLPMRFYDRMSYKHHGDTISLQGGSFHQFYTEYRIEDIESIEKRKTIPLFTNLNPFLYRYFGNPYSAKNCSDIYIVKFREDYRIFQAGEYVKLKNGNKGIYKQFRYLTIPVGFLDKSLQGIRPDLVKTS